MKKIKFEVEVDEKYAQGLKNALILAVSEVSQKMAQ
jgi:hypothetical protein